jgi:DNA-binding HxlR family transcriptional regulator
MYAAEHRMSGVTKSAFYDTPLGGPETCVNPAFPPKRYVKVRFHQCPVGLSLGVLGRKWALLILRDIGAYGVDRFNRLRESIPGIPPKVLSTRLRELEMLGLIEKVESSRSPIRVRWGLTDRGRDLIPVMMMITAFQSKHNPELIHPGRSSMKVHEMYDREAMQILKGML